MTHYGYSKHSEEVDNAEAEKAHIRLCLLKAGSKKKPRPLFKGYPAPLISIAYSSMYFEAGTPQIGHFSVGIPSSI